MDVDAVIKQFRKFQTARSPSAAATAETNGDPSKTAKAALNVFYPPAANLAFLVLNAESKVPFAQYFSFVSDLLSPRLPDPSLQGAAKRINHWNGFCSHDLCTIWACFWIFLSISYPSPSCLTVSTSFCILNMEPSPAPASINIQHITASRNIQYLSATCFTCSPLAVCGHLSVWQRAEDVSV